MMVLFTRYLPLSFILYFICINLVEEIYSFAGYKKVLISLSLFVQEEFQLALFRNSTNRNLFADRVSFFMYKVYNNVDFNPDGANQNLSN